MASLPDALSVCLGEKREAKCFQHRSEGSRGKGVQLTFELGLDGALPPRAVDGQV